MGSDAKKGKYEKYVLFITKKLTEGFYHDFCEYPKLRTHQ
ncbi:hypothetical protein [Klebsiella pneumoniae ISC21]|nr:hypothetical protein [Klebsiella pneumoniae ISC21]